MQVHILVNGQRRALVVQRQESPRYDDENEEDEEDLIVSVVACIEGQG